jgi:hypothetical protein
MLLARRSLAVSLSLCLALYSIGPSVAVACEGAGEETPKLVNSKGEKLQRGFTIRSGRSSLVDGVAAIVCTSDEVEGARQVRLNTAEATRVVLRGCERGGVGCNSPRAAAREVVTGAVEFILVFDPADLTRVFWLIEERGGGQGVFVTVECNGGRETYRIRGGALSAIAPVNRRTKTLTAEFEQKEGKQTLTEYLNGKGEKVKDVFEAEGEGEEKLALKEIGFSSTEELKFEEEVEIVT